MGGEQVLHGGRTAGTGADRGGRPGRTRRLQGRRQGVPARKCDHRKAGKRHGQGDQGHQRLLERTDEQPDRKVRRISAPAQRNQNGGRRARLHKISGLSGKTERQDRSGDRAWKEPAGHFVLHQGRGHRELGEGIWLVQERMVLLGDHEPHLAGSVQRRIHQEVRPVPARPCCGRNRFYGRQPFEEGHGRAEKVQRFHRKCADQRCRPV